MKDLTDTLVELVDTPSVIGDEGRLCTAIAERLLASLDRDAVERLGNSLVAGRRTDKPLLTLYGHIDTVPDQGQGPARVEGDRLYGLGASDMKAGLAVMIHLLEDAAVTSGPYDVIGVFYDKEEGPAHENGLIEVLERAPWLADAEFAVVMEPTDLELQLGCQGAINARGVFTGAAAHSARPWLGENAVTKAGAWLAALHDRPPERVDVAGLEFLEVLSVTRAEGGIANNVIPPRFEVNLNYRFPPTLDLDAAEARLRKLVAGVDELKVTDRAPAAGVPDGNPHLERLAAASGAARTAKQAWTDVARLAAVGVPAINYGPGETAQAHQPGESVPLENMYVAFQAMRDFLTT